MVAKGKKCLWIHDEEGVCIKEDDVDLAIELAQAEADSKLEAKWIKNPNFKKYIIEQGRNNLVYPSTLVQEIREATSEYEMKSDLKRWSKKVK